MVAAAALWLRAVRPSLTADQVADVMRDSAVDIFTPGWDARTGFGMLNVARALGTPQRSADSYEPNDDVIWVDGSTLAAAQPVFKKKRNLTPFEARLDKYKDQVDVYRAVVRPKSTLRATLRNSSGNADLEIWSRKAKTVLNGNKGLIDISHKKAAGADTASVKNRTSRKRSLYVVAFIDANTVGRSADYVLRVR
jgi:hypothetical protein